MFLTIACLSSKEVCRSCLGVGTLFQGSQTPKDEIYVHLSLLFWKPWKPTFTVLDRIGQAHYRVRSDGSNRPQFLSYLNFVAQVNGSDRWTVALLELASSSDGRVLSVDLTSVNATGISDEDTLIWRGSEEEMRHENLNEVSPAIQSQDNLTSSFVAFFVQSNAELFLCPMLSKHVSPFQCVVSLWFAC